MKPFALFAKLLVLALSISIFSCEVEPSIDVNQDKIWAEYELIYQADEDQTLATARFRFGNPAGTLLELSDPASVTFDGEIMLFNPVTTRYEYTMPGMQSQGTFVYEDLDGNRFTNTSPEIVFTEFPDSPEILSLSKSADYDLEWNGTALEADQGVSVLIGPKLFIEENDGMTQITLYASKLQNLDKTSYLGNIERWESLEVLEGTSEGGVIRAKYQGKRINVEIVE